MHRICSIIFTVLFLSHDAGAQGWLWGRGAIGHNTSSWPVATDYHGNEFVAGVSSGPISFNGFLPPFNTGDDLGLLTKYDSYGDFLWVRNADNGSQTYPLDICTDSAGDCYVLGWSPDADIKIGGRILHNSAYPDIQYFIAKFDSLGNVSWISPAGSHKGSAPTLFVPLDGTIGATIRRDGSITVGKNGDLYVTVPFNALTITIGTTTLTNANNDAFALSDDILVTKYDASGNIIWVTSFGGNRTDVPTGITLTPQGSVYVSGVFNSDGFHIGTSLVTNISSQKWTGFIARYDDYGSPLWGGAIHGTGNNYAAGIASDTANNVYVVGSSTGNDVNIGGTNVTAAYTGIPYLYLLKLDTANSLGWFKTIGSPTGGVTCGYSVDASPQGAICISGSFTQQIIIDGHAIGIPDKSVNPVFIAGFEPTVGGYLYNGTLQSGGNRQSDIALAPDGVYLCSDYQFPCWPFIVGDNVLPCPYEGQSWLFLAKYVFQGGPGGAGGPGGSGGHLTNTSRDITVCLESGSDVQLRGRDGYLLYNWSNGTSDSVLNVTEPGTYWVKSMGATDYAITDTVHVNSLDALCNCNAMVPTAFSPNGDGMNELFGPVFRDGCEIRKYAFAIYNRWGEQVFYTADPSVRWDGMYKGQPAEGSVYMYYLRYSVNPSYPEYIKKGDMTVVR